MDTTPHDAVIPYDDVNAEKQIKKFLQEKFEKENWWARNKYFWALVVGLYSALVISWVCTADIEGLILEYGKAAGAIPFLVFTSYVPLLFVLALMKYFLYYRKWKKYEEEWGLQEDN